MIINPLNIAADSPGELVAVYAATLALVLAAASIVLAACPRRRAWARRHRMQCAMILAAFWLATLYGGSKTNQPPVIVVDGYRVPIYWDEVRDRYVPARVPLRGWHP